MIIKHLNSHKSAMHEQPCTIHVMWVYLHAR